MTEADPERRLSAAPLNDTIDHFFRHNSGKMVASLCRSFGFDKIDLVEDAVQDALIAAMKTWPYSGIPEEQFAWLFRTAKNRCIDILRRENRILPIADDVETVGDQNKTIFPGEIGEDQLQMIFACCHPALSPDSRVALTLKIVGGFSVNEIASSFLSNSEAVTRLLTRAKSRLRDLGVRMEIPEPVELTERLNSVLKCLYLMFNEGYSASIGETLIRKDLVFEAIRLVSTLAAHPATNSPTVDALAALFCFQAARMPARADHNGELLILAQQDRNLWDKELISKGIQHLRLSASEDTVSDFHLESEIAAIYTLAPDHHSIDWRRILAAYEKLQNRQFSPVRELNRTIVVGEIEGAEAAYSQLLQLEKTLSHYNLFFITKAHYENLIARPDLAYSSLKTAAKLTSNESILRFIEAKLRTIESTHS